MLKKIGKTAIIFAALFLVFLITGSIMAISGGAKFVTENVNVENIDSIIGKLDDYSFHIGDGSITAGPVDDVDIEASIEMYDGVETITLSRAAYAIDIVSGGGNELTVRYSGSYSASLIEKYDLDSDSVSASDIGPIAFTANDDSIEIGFDYRTGSFDAGTMTIELPDSFTGTLEFDDLAGEINADGLELEELKFSDMAGEVDFVDCTVGKLTLNDITGEINVSGVVGCIDARNILGEVDVVSTAPFTDDSRLESILGEITIELPEGAYIDPTVTSSLGEIDIDSDLRKSGAPAFTITSVMGEVKISIDD